MKTLGLSAICLLVFLTLVGIVSGIVATVVCPFWEQLATIFGGG